MSSFDELEVVSGHYGFGINEGLSGTEAQSLKGLLEEQLFLVHHWGESSYSNVGIPCFI